MAAGSAALLFLLLDRLTSRRIALVLTGAYALGTSVWSISSQALWQHTAGGLFLVLAVLFLQRWNENRKSVKLLALSGLWAGLALSVRVPNLFLAGAIAVVLLVRGAGFRALAAFLAPVICFGLLTSAWNLWLFQDLRGYASVPIAEQPLAGLAGLLFSPSRGLLVYCPFVAFAAVGIVAWWKGAYRNLSLLLTVSAIFCVATLALVSTWPMWWGGHCWGPRLLTEMTPFLILLMVPAMNMVMARRWLGAVFACLLLYSVSLQFVGAFFYPNGYWEDLPVNADFHPQRFWDWSDNPIRRSLQAGFEGKPYVLAVEAALHGPSAAIRKIEDTGYKGF